MNVGQAKALARQWVHAEGGRLPGFAGPFFHGSVVWLPDETPLPTSPAVDVMVVVDEPNPPIKIGKLEYRGILLDASCLPLARLQSAEQVLGQYHLAGSLRTAKPRPGPNWSADAPPDGGGHLLRLAGANDGTTVVERELLAHIADDD